MTALHIADPCHESWDAMTPNREGRHCASCDKTVVDVTSMVPTEARAYLNHELPARVQRGEHVCVRAHADRSGRLLRGGVKRRLLTNGLAAVLAMAMADYAGLGSSLQAAEGGDPQLAEPLRGESMPAVGGLVAPEPAKVGKIVAPMMGNVCVEPNVLSAQPITPVTDAASDLTFTADAETFVVVATRADTTVAWSVNITTRGVPADAQHLIRALVHDGRRLTVCYGGEPDGEPLHMNLDPATGAKQ